MRIQSVGDVGIDILAVDGIHGIYDIAQDIVIAFYFTNGNDIGLQGQKSVRYLVGLGIKFILVIARRVGGLEVS